MTTATLAKWGNSQGVLIPRAFCEQLGLKAGDKVSIELEDSRIIVAPPREKYTFQARKLAWNGDGQPIRDMDWGSPVGEEIW